MGIFVWRTPKGSSAVPPPGSRVPRVGNGYDGGKKPKGIKFLMSDGKPAKPGKHRQ